MLILYVMFQGPTCKSVPKLSDLKHLMVSLMFFTSLVETTKKNYFWAKVLNLKISTRELTIN